MFIRIGDWFKSTRNRTGTTAGSLFGSLKESNSAADAIAHGGQVSLPWFNVFGVCLNHLKHNTPLKWDLLHSRGYDMSKSDFTCL